jgi:DNA modification methylase
MFTATKPLQIERVAISALHKDPRNARKHPRENVDAVKASLSRFGQQKPIVVDATGQIVAGNCTAAAAQSLGWTHVDVVRTELAGADATAFAIADNRTAELAAWDNEVLADHLKALRDLDFDLGAMGFDEDALAKLVVSAVQDGQTDPDDVPAPPDEATTRPGDIWILGNHRLLCGDSSLPQDVDRLLEGRPIHLVNTDPPYNVKVEPRSNNAIAAGLSSFSAAKATHHQSMDVALHPEKSKATHKQLRAKDRPLANDFVTDAEFDRLLDAWFGNMARVLVPGRGFYIWGGYANLGNYPPFLKKHGLYFSQGIVWDKEHPVLTRKDFMGAFEIAFYGWKEGAAHLYLGPNNATDLWHVKKVNPQNMVHLTEKPTELAVRSMQYSSRRGENVLDLFGGSGSTLIAAEQAERAAFLVELDTLYCDVIVQRWEKFTGRKAELIAAA